MKNNRQLVEFNKPLSMGNREWGEELLLALSPGNYTLKKLFIKAGKKGGLQYHRIKDESAYVVSGKMIIRFDLGDGLLQEKIVSAGDCFRFPPLCVHQEEAITDCIIIEASTPISNDRVRVEKEYGIPELPGLPTTNDDEINYL